MRVKHYKSTKTTFDKCIRGLVPTMLASDAITPGSIPPLAVSSLVSSKLNIISYEQRERGGTAGERRGSKRERRKWEAREEREVEMGSKRERRERKWTEMGEQKWTASERGESRNGREWGEQKWTAMGEQK